jgi:hypothetical protein
VSGPHFRDYHLLFEEQADQILASTDVLAERVRKLGGTTLRSIGHIARTQRVRDNDAEYVDPQDMLTELQEDNGAFAARLREAHGPLRGAARRGLSQRARALHRRGRAPALVPLRDSPRRPSRLSLSRVRSPITNTP